MVEVRYLHCSVLISLALYTDNLLPASRVQNQRGKTTAPEAPRIESFTVFLNIEAALRVVAIHDCGVLRGAFEM
jgi:hypothetical protein